MPLDPNYLAEIEQAVIQKNNLNARLSDPSLSSEKRQEIQTQIQNLDTYLNQIFGSTLNQSSNVNPNNTLTSSPNLESNLRSQIKNLQLSLNEQIRENQSLIDQLKLVSPKNTNQLSNNPTLLPAGKLVNESYNQTYNQVGDKIIKNVAQITGTQPSSLKDYAYLAWDYMMRDRLPKLLSSRLWLVVGGGFLTERLGQDTTVKIVSIVLLIVVYLISEGVVKFGKEIARGSNSNVIQLRQ